PAPQLRDLDLPAGDLLLERAGELLVLRALRFQRALFFLELLRRERCLAQLLVQQGVLLLHVGQLLLQRGRLFPLLLVLLQALPRVALLRRQLPLPPPPPHPPP